MASTDQLVTRAKLILSRANDPNVDAKIIVELQAAQERLEQEAFLPEFLYTHEDITAILDEIDLETALTRYIRLHNNAGGVMYRPGPDDGGPEQFLKLKRYDERDQLMQQYSGAMESGGSVRGYFMVDTLMTLRPYPSSVIPQDLRIHFYQSELTLPDVGVTNLWTRKAGDYILGNAGKLVAESLRDQTAMQVFQGLEATGKARLIKKSLGDEQADQDYVMGD